MFVVLAVVGFAIAAGAQIVRGALDAGRSAGYAFSPTGILEPLAIIRRSPALTDLTLIALIYAATQSCLTTFFVVHLTEALGWTLITAGLALAVVTLGGVAGRIGWGFVADRLLPPRLVLGALGVVACVCSLIFASAHANWPIAGLLCGALVFGGTAIGWNGVQLSELARHAPAGVAGAVTGASGFVTISGVVVGPLVFTLLATLTGSYRAGFIVFGVMSGLGGLTLLLRGRWATGKWK